MVYNPNHFDSEKNYNMYKKKNENNQLINKMWLQHALLI